MTKRIKYIVAMAMAVLMLAATFGTVAVSATTLPEDPYTRTVYFVNVKDWDNVSAYTWTQGEMPEVPFPGNPLEFVGTVDLTAIEYGINGEDFEVYKMEIKDGDDLTIFNEGYCGGQESKPLYTRLPYADIEFYGLDTNNYAVKLYDIAVSDIQPMA